MRVPYYIVFNRYTDQFQAFGLTQGRYQPLDVPEQKLWIPEINLGMGVWQGSYNGITRPWLRWYDDQERWILTAAETAEQERQRANQAEALLEQERQQREQLLERLRAKGINLDEL